MVFFILKIFVYKKIIGKEWENVSNEAKDLVKKLIVVDSKKILSIQDALRHPWIL